MYKEIKIGDKTIPMLANAATPIRYKMIFHKDILKALKSINNDDLDTASIGELAFMMSMQSEAQSGKVKLSELNFDKYLEWLEQFNPLDIEMSAEDIVNLYSADAETSSEPKKKEKKN